MATNKLGFQECNNAKPRKKPHKMADGNGLSLMIMPNGTKRWVQKYRYGGKEKCLSHGIFPRVSIQEARERREEALALLRQGKDPSIVRKEEKIQRKISAANTFEAIAREWHEENKGRWTEKYANTIINRLEADLFPKIGNIPIKNISYTILLDTLKSIQDRGVFETTRRARQYCRQIYAFARATGRVDINVARDITDDGFKVQKETKHYASLEAKDLPFFLKALQRNESRSYPQTMLAVELMMLTFVRTKELVETRWEEIDFEKRMWTIPAERMKMGHAHLVPLSDQAIEILERLREFNGHREWVFASHVKPRQHISNNTILSVIYRAGYKGLMTGHGFRAMAMTIIQEELGFPWHVPDRQLAHKPPGSLGSAYDRAQFLKERKAMMQEWANYLDRVRGNGKVVPINQRKSGQKTS